MALKCEVCRDRLRVCRDKLWFLCLSRQTQSLARQTLVLVFVATNYGVCHNKDKLQTHVATKPLLLSRTKALQNFGKIKPLSWTVAMALKCEVCCDKLFFFSNFSRP